MDNFRKINNNKRSRPVSVDGFKPPKSRKPVKGSPPLVGHNQAYQPKSSMLGDFKTTEGFHPARQSVIKSSLSVGRQPHRGPTGRIALDLPESTPKAKPKHRFKRFRRLSRPKKALASLASVFVVFALIGGFLFAKGYINLRRILKGGAEGAAALQKNVDPSRLRGEGDGRVNILLLGKGGPGHEAPDLTDTILVASIDPVQKQAALVSIPRDLYVKTGAGNYVKINQVYADAKNKVLSGKKTSDQAQRAEDAGMSAIESMVQSKLGIPIHYHAMVDFAAFEQSINTVGGIDMNVPTELAVREQMYIEGRGQYLLNVPAGQQHFDGIRALMFSRTRHTSARGDFDRAERQRLVLMALKNKVLSAGTYTNPVKISQLMSAFGDHVQTNMSINDMERLYDIGKDISKIDSVGLADPPNNYITTGMMNGLSVVIPRAGVGNYKEIQNFIRNKLRDSYLAQENASVIVLNGTTTSGLATRTSDELKSYGYTVGQIGDAPTKTYTNTVIVDMRNGQKKYTKNYLEKRFGVTAVTSLPDTTINPGTADFVIILGSNEVTRLEQ